MYPIVYTDTEGNDKGRGFTDKKIIDGMFYEIVLDTTGKKLTVPIVYCVSPEKFPLYQSMCREHTRLMKNLQDDIQKELSYFKRF